MQAAGGRRMAGGGPDAVGDVHTIGKMGTEIQTIWKQIPKILQQIQKIAKSPKDLQQIQKIWK